MGDGRRDWRAVLLPAAEQFAERRGRFAAAQGVYCVSQLAQQRAGHPDFSLYAARQVQAGRPKQGQTPEGGVVEVKSATDDAWPTSDAAQVSGYWERYRLALVTNTRGFVLLG